MPRNPFGPIRLASDLDREIEAAFSQLIHQPWGQSGRLHAWQPALDVFETEDEYLLEVDLPGVAKQDLELHVDEHSLSLRGQRRSMTVRQSSQEVRMERAHGEFYRSIHFDQAVDPKRMEVRCEEGILHVCLPKQKTGPR